MQVAPGVIDKRVGVSSTASSVNTSERSMLESDDTLSQIIEHTTECDAALAFYYKAKNNKVSFSVQHTMDGWFQFGKFYVIISVTIFNMRLLPLQKVDIIFTTKLDNKVSFSISCRISDTFQSTKLGKRWFFFSFEFAKYLVLIIRKNGIGVIQRTMADRYNISLQ